MASDGCAGSSPARGTFFYLSFMKRISFLATPTLVLFISLMLLSCGSGGNRFKISGRILHLSQGMFLVYSPDGSLDHIDTINVEAGRFAYEMMCEEPTTLVLVMPNFSEQPIFAEPGASVEIEADASHLREMEIKGTKENELMSAFRRQTVDASPPETRKLAADFIRNHKSSAVSLYLLKRYFVADMQADRHEALRLIDELMAENGDNSELKAQRTYVQRAMRTATGSTLPAFTARDINGNAVSSAMFARGVGIIYTWASWSFESQNTQRRLNAMLSEYGQRLTMLGVNIDASTDDCRAVVSREHVAIRQICDGKMFSSPVLTAVGLSDVPEFMVVKDGRIALRTSDFQRLSDEIKQMIK